MPDARSPRSEVLQAAKAVGQAGGNEPYAVVGGAACCLLGSSRTTEDVDIVVPRGHVPAMRAALRRSPAFTVDPKTLHTHFSAPTPIRIDILAPPTMFREAYDAKTPTIIVDDIKVLDPVLILNAKCGSVFRRSTDDKRKSDAFDILFLLQYLLDHQAPPLTRAVLSSVDQHFMAEILRWLPDSQPFWKGLGYDFELGRFPDDVEPAEGQTST